MRQSFRRTREAPGRSQTSPNSRVRFLLYRSVVLSLQFEVISTTNELVLNSLFVRQRKNTRAVSCFQTSSFLLFICLRLSYTLTALFVFCELQKMKFLLKHSSQNGELFPWRSSTELKCTSNTKLEEDTKKKETKIKTIPDANHNTYSRRSSRRQNRTKRTQQRGDFKILTKLKHQTNSNCSPVSSERGKNETH